MPDSSMHGVSIREGRTRNGRTRAVAALPRRDRCTRSAAAAATLSGQRVLHGPARELRAPTQARLLADAREVVLHRARRDVQALGDLLVRAAARDEAQDLVLALAQQRADVGLLAARRARVLLEQVAGQHRRDDRAAAVDGDDRLAQLLARRALGQVARGAGGDRVEQRWSLL